MNGPEVIRIKFDGGLAHSGQLHFYEWSRSQYALARFVATVEHFRRTGKITDRITLQSNIDIIVKSPERGSFVEDILVPAIQEGLATAISAPLSAVISYVWQLMSPRTEKTETTIRELANIRAAEESNPAVALEQERTKQEQIRLEQLKVWKEIGEGERANTKAALDLVRWAIGTSHAAVARLGLSQAELQDIEQELTAEEQRQEEFAQHEQALSGIEESKINRLTSRLRPMVPEIGLPLRRSADRLSIGRGKDGTTYAQLNPEVIASIENKVSEDVVVEITGRVKSFDRDSGVGKVTSPTLPRVLNFVVPPGDRSRLIEKILSSMLREKVTLICRRVVDKSGLPTSLILIDVDLEVEEAAAE